jgi:hypothetical protein
MISYLIRIKLEGITDRPALDGAKEVEHVEHRVGAVRNDGVTVVDITVTLTRTYTPLSGFVQLVDRFLLLMALAASSFAARLRQRSNFLDFQHNLHFGHTREPIRAVVQRLKHANLSLELSHSKHFIYSIKMSQIPYSDVNKVDIDNEMTIHTDSNVRGGAPPTSAITSL